MYEDIIADASKKYGVSKNLIKAVIQAESGGNASATSPAGAQGLMQLMPSTAKSLGVTNPYDPRQNIMGGTKYLADAIKNNGGRVDLALAAYNAGQGAVNKYGGVPPYAETQNYVKKIMGSLNDGDITFTDTVDGDVVEINTTFWGSIVTVGAIVICICIAVMFFISAFKGGGKNG